MKGQQNNSLEGTWTKQGSGHFMILYPDHVFLLKEKNLIEGTYQIEGKDLILTYAGLSERYEIHDSYLIDDDGQKWKKE